MFWLLIKIQPISFHWNDNSMHYVGLQYTFVPFFFGLTDFGGIEDFGGMSDFACFASPCVVTYRFKSSFSSNFLIGPPFSSALQH